LFGFERGLLARVARGDTLRVVGDRAVLALAVRLGGAFFVVLRGAWVRHLQWLLCRLTPEYPGAHAASRGGIRGSGAACIGQHRTRCAGTVGCTSTARRQGERRAVNLHPIVRIFEDTWGTSTLNLGNSEKATICRDGGLQAIWSRLSESN